MNLKNIFFYFVFFACVGLFASENYRTNNEGQDFNLCQKAAKEGDPIAQYKLGEMYHKGKGCEQNYGKAFEWYKKAAEQGNVDACREIGHLYMISGRFKNYKLAFKCYNYAAAQGDVKAQFFLGEMYFNGDGVKKDEAKASYWHKKAFDGIKKLAEQGDSDAQLCLGKIYGREVNGVKGDANQEIKWAELAAGQGNIEAQFYLGNTYFSSSILEKMKGDKAKASTLYRKASNWYEKAFDGIKKLAEQGVSDAQFRLGDMYRVGKGVERDREKSKKWYKMAAQQGHYRAQFALGYLYKWVEQDMQKAFEWYKKAAEQGWAAAQSALGDLYLMGAGVERDTEEGVKWIKKAAEQGNKEAQEKLKELSF